MSVAVRSAPDLRPPAGAAPSWAVRARGAQLWDGAGRLHIDWGCAAGAVLLGHADPGVEAAVAEPDAAAEACAAGRLCSGLPGACDVRFTPDAASARALACAAAVRATGRPEVLEITADEAPETLAARLGGGRAAAAVVASDVLAPVLVRALRAMTAAAGVLLVLDETSTGLRRGPGGLQAAWGVRADLSVWGAGLANGRSVGAVTGEASLLAHAPEGAPAPPSSLAAVAATLLRVEQEDAALHLAVRGAETEAMLERLAADAGLEDVLTVTGDPTAVTLRFTGARGPALRRRFAAQLAARGVHAPGPLHVGLRHEDAEIDALLDAAAAALEVLAATPAPERRDAA